MIHVIVFNLFMLAACGYALWKGGAPERWTAIVFLGGAVATFAVPDYDAAHPYGQLEPILLSIDAAMLIALTGIALYANRFWPLYVSALHFIAIAIHGVKGFEPQLVPWMYAGASSKIAYPMLALLVVGAWRHGYRQAVFGNDHDWSPSYHAESKRT